MRRGLNVGVLGKRHEPGRHVLHEMRQRTQRVDARGRRGARQLGSRLSAKHDLLLERRERRGVAPDGEHGAVNTNPVADISAGIRRAQREYVLEHRPDARGVLHEELARRVENLELGDVRLAREVPERSLEHGEGELEELFALLRLRPRRVLRLDPFLLRLLSLLCSLLRSLLVDDGESARPCVGGVRGVCW